MSFGRAKTPCCNENRPVSAREGKAAENLRAVAGKTQKTDKWAPPKSTRNPPLIKPVKPRSSSQPSPTAGANSPNSLRPRSVGNDKFPFLRRAGSVQKSAIVEQREPEDELEYKSATVLKNCERECKSDALSDAGDVNEEAERNSNCESDRKSITNEIEDTKGGSASGIPLRVKQAQPPANVAKVSPKIIKTASHSSTVSSTQNRGSLSRGSTGLEMRVVASAERRNLETQFQARKKRLDLMKKELFLKQKLVKDSYHVLVQLKRKLEEAGNTTVVLEDLVLHDGKPATPHSGEPNRLEDAAVIPKPEVDPEIVQNMKEIIKDIPLSLIEICKHLMTKRLVLLDTLEKTSESNIDPEDLQEHIKVYQEESTKLEQMLEEKCSDQDKHVDELVRKWQSLLQNSGDTAAVIDKIEQLQSKLVLAEQNYATVWNDLQHLTQLNEQSEKKCHHSDALINELKEKIKHIEQELTNEKTSAQTLKDKSSTFELKMKSMKNRVQEVESKFKESESKYNELQKSLKHTQEQLKVNEHRWTKEKEDLLLKNKHDKQLLDKLTKDRSFFEARVKSLEKTVETAEKKLTSGDTKMREDLEKEKKSGAELKVKLSLLQEKCDSLKEQLSEAEAKGKQAIDIVKTIHTFEPSETDGITTDREAELYTELLATRVALKSAEEQIGTYNREKLRFIDSIQMLQGDPERDQDSVARTLIKNVENITELESKLAESDDVVCNQKIEIANLMAEIENLKQRSVIQPAIQDEDDSNKDSELKMMLHEGKLKLEQSLKKSLEFEHKIIRYEHDLSKQSKQICEMENLLKVRDGLISMMKAKKDELQMANDSLNKYANDIRELLIQAQEEARHRSELVAELTLNLDSRGRLCQQLEKKVKELEGSLSTTNEKRFKLQDTLGAMEKELQSTKAHIINMSPDIQTRYDNKPPFTNKSHTQTKTLPIKRPSCITCNVPIESPQKNTSVAEENLYLGQNVPTREKHKIESCSNPIIPPQYVSSHRDFKSKSHNVMSYKDTFASSDIFCNCKSNSKLTTGVEPWINSYQNMQSIQKRLKFLKYAFKSLSKTLFHRDIALKTYTNKVSNITENGSPKLRLSSTQDSKNKSDSGTTVSREFISCNNLQALYKECDSKCSLITQRSNQSLKKHFNSNIEIKCDTQLKSKTLLPTVSDHLLQHKHKRHPPRPISPPLRTPPRKKIVGHTKEQHVGLYSPALSPVLTKDSGTPETPNIPNSKCHSVSAKASCETNLSSLLKMPGSSSSEFAHCSCEINAETVPHNLRHNKKIRRLHQRSKPISGRSHKNTTSSYLELASPDQRKHKSEVLVKSHTPPTPRFCLSTTSIGECSRFINHVQNISTYLEYKHNHGETCNAEMQYVPKLSSGIHRRKAKVKSSCPLKGYKSFADMEIKTVSKTHDLIINSLNKINADLTSSINLLTKNFRKSESQRLK